MFSRFTFVIGTQTSGKIEVLREMNSMRVTRAPEHSLVTMTGILSSPENSLAPYNVNAMFDFLHRKVVERSSIITIHNRPIKRPAKILFVLTLGDELDKQVDYLNKQKSQIKQRYAKLKLEYIFILVVINHSSSSANRRVRSFSIEKREELSKSDISVIQQLAKDLDLQKERIINYANYTDMRGFVAAIRQVLKRPAFPLTSSSSARISVLPVKPIPNTTYLMDESPGSHSPKSPLLLKIDTELDPIPLRDSSASMDEKVATTLLEKCPIEPFSLPIDIIVLQPAKDEKQEIMKGRVLDRFELLQRKMRLISKWDNEKYGEINELITTYLSSILQARECDTEHFDQRKETLNSFRSAISKLIKTCPSSGKILASLFGLTLGGLAGAALSGPGAPVFAAGGKIVAGAVFGATAVGGAASLDDAGIKQLIFDIAEVALEFAKCHDIIDEQHQPLPSEAKSQKKKV